MNPFAYRTTSLAIKAIAGLSRARLNLHGAEQIPEGPTIFVVNHFTRIETFLLPYHFHRLTGRPVWALAAAELFVGRFGRYIEQLGAVSTRSPDRDRLMVKTLLAAEANWLIFPEGRMVKNKKIMEKGRFMISYAGGKHPPHTGAATLALRTEFYRQRLLGLMANNPKETQRLVDLFQLESTETVCRQATCIVPVNLTYYPLRARENALNRLTELLVKGLPQRVTEEIITEGDMLLSGVDIDIRFGRPIEISDYLDCKRIQKDIRNPGRIGFDDAISSKKRMRRAALKIMQRYMADIYRMTTVNHDHLLASCLKKLPVRHIDTDNLKRRVFLASRSDKATSGYFFHKNFEKDQVHLLTDDRYRHFSEFMDFAIEKGVVTSKGSLLEKDPARLAAMFDFHRSRIDNPIAVIANEVEPLTRLQQKISRLSWMPEFWLKRKVARLLLRRSLEEFKRDYDAWAEPTVSKPPGVARPVLIRGYRRRIGVVLAHGYMAAPAEVMGLARFLGKKGYWVYTPRLKGHGTAPEDLANCRFSDWIDSMDAGYAVISNLCRRVIAGGFSTGAGLALDLAQRVPEVAGVFAVSAPLRLQDVSARFVPAVDVWNRVMGRFHMEDAKKTFVDNQPENPHINYLKNPISGVRELERLMTALEPRLPLITQPALLIQSREDPVVNPKGTEKIFKLLGSEDKQMVMFNFQRHGILLGEGSERVYRTIGNFIDQLGKNTPVKPSTAETPAEKKEDENLLERRF